MCTVPLLECSVHLCIDQKTLQCHILSFHLQEIQRLSHNSYIAVGLKKLVCELLSNTNVLGNLEKVRVRVYTLRTGAVVYYFLVKKTYIIGH